MFFIFCVTLATYYLVVMVTSVSVPKGNKLYCKNAENITDKVYNIPV